MADIRELLQKAERPNSKLDIEISKALFHNVVVPVPFSTDYDFAIRFIEEYKKYDWTMGNVNGHMGGTPYATVGVTDDKSSYAATPLLSLWLSYFRLELGDERQ
jgi:hypothetical protein